MMKESYFTPQTIAGKAQQFCREYAAGRNRRLERFDAQRSVLLVLDMQAYFLQPESHAYIPSAPVILPGLRQLVDAYAAGRLPVIFTRHLNTPQNAACMASWWSDILTEENHLSMLAPELEPAAGDVLFKTQYDAFHGTRLEVLLHSMRVEQLVICGVMTHLCCETTARSAFVRGFEVFFTLDGTATYTEAHHRATLLNLSHGFAALALVSEVVVACREETNANT